MSAGNTDLRKRVDTALERRSPAMLACFARIFTRALRQQFHAVRLSRQGLPPDPTPARLIIYSNHPSWWDAMVYVLLARRFFKERAGYAPIERSMAQRYGFMTRIGAFGTEPHSHREGVFFLAFCEAVLARREGLLCIAAQGRFADPRERPVRLASGLAHLVARAPQACLLPLAIEYAFWSERRPEICLRFGMPTPAASLAALPVAQRSAQLAAALQQTLDGLAAEVIAREPAAFETLLAGSVGVGGVYDVWRRMRCTWRGEPFSAAHGDGR